MSDYLWRKTGSITDPKILQDAYYFISFASIINVPIRDVAKLFLRVNPVSARAFGDHREGLLESRHHQHHHFLRLILGNLVIFYLL